MYTKRICIFLLKQKWKSCSCFYNKKKCHISKKTEAKTKPWRLLLLFLVFQPEFHFVGKRVAGWVVYEFVKPF